jgi:type III restriction enzyme
MKLQFKKQAYQADAVDSVVDCFAGQPKSTGIQYRIDLGVHDKPLLAHGHLDELSGFKNSDLVISLQQVFENIHSVQRRQNLPLSSSLISTKPALFMNIKFLL